MDLSLRKNLERAQRGNLEAAQWLIKRMPGYAEALAAQCREAVSGVVSRLREERPEWWAIYGGNVEAGEEEEVEAGVPWELRQTRTKVHLFPPVGTEGLDSSRSACKRVTLEQTEAGNALTAGLPYSEQKQLYCKSCYKAVGAPNALS